MIGGYRSFMSRLCTNPMGVSTLPAGGRQAWLERETMDKRTFLEGPPFWRNIYLGYQLVKFCLGLFLVIWFAWSFIDLFRPQALRKPIHETYPVLKNPEDAAKIARELRRIDTQERCVHMTETRGLKNFFCPVCGKKLLPGEPPRWQI